MLYQPCMHHACINLLYPHASACCIHMYPLDQVLPAPIPCGTKDEREVVAASVHGAVKADAFSTQVACASRTSSSNRRLPPLPPGLALDQLLHLLPA